MQIYLPIAQISLHIFVLLGLGCAVGFLSGIFGIGGGFLITPLLIFLGVSPEVAAASGANQVVGTSVTGAVNQWQRDNIDFKMGSHLTIGGLAGAVLGVGAVAVLRSKGLVDIFITLTYVVVLGALGIVMVIEGWQAVRASRNRQLPPARRAGQHNWIQKLPFKQRFPKSKIYASVLPPLGIGLVVGLLSAVMGVGGGFLMIPAMIYLLRMPTRIVIGTSMFQIAFITAAATIMHAAYNQTVDVVLALVLLTGGVVGAEFGAQTSQRLGAEQLRLLLGLLVLFVSLRLAVDLILPPRDPYTLRRLVEAPLARHADVGSVATRRTMTGIADAAGPLPHPFEGPAGPATAVRSPS